MEKCTRCEHLSIAIKEKDDEIHNLKQEIQNLKKLFRSKLKLHQRCLNSSNNDTNNCCFGQPYSGEPINPIKESKICDSEQENGKIKYSRSVLKEENKEYVYDETMNMHYCISTGYYYDMNSGLFYIPENDAYYKFDYSKNQYELVKSRAHTTDTNEDTNEKCESVVDKVNNLNLNDEEDKCILNVSSVQEDSNVDTIYRSEENNGNEIKEEEITNESSNDWQPPEGSNATVGDLVREVAEQNSGMSDYIYDEKCQMYISKSTGYFYDPIRKLLYDPEHKVYYLYDQEKMSYDFYCHADSVDQPSPSEVGSKSSESKSSQVQKEHKVKKKKKWRKQSLQNTKRPDIQQISESSSSSAEEGEVFSSESDLETSQSLENEVEQVVDPVTSRLPCIRAIVESSERIKIGTLILITCTGGVIGRDKPSVFLLPDISVSKAHAVVKFCYESNSFSIEDLGSQNGTFINETRLSEPKQKSQPYNLKHGDKLCLGSCKMLIHIHEGHETCDKCEPGQVMAELSLQEAKVVPVLKTKEEKEKERKRALKIMKNKYGLGGMDYASDKTASAVSLGYKDMAELRRKALGSENPYEKTQTASMEESMCKSNKGYKMLQKLGWKEGESLGASGTGISEPIPLRPWVSKAGFGSTEAEASCAPVKEDRRKRKWVKAQERYLQISQ